MTMTELQQQEFEHLQELQSFLKSQDDDYQVLEGKRYEFFDYVRHVADYFIYDLLGFCGCGAMINSAEVIYDYLKIVSIRTETIDVKAVDTKFIGDAEREINLWLIKNCLSSIGPLSYERRYDLAKEITYKCFNQNYMTNDPILQIVAYLCDNVGFTDHGSSINGCWIEDLGRAAIYALGLRIKYDKECQVIQ